MGKCNMTRHHGGLLQSDTLSVHVDFKGCISLSHLYLKQHRLMLLYCRVKCLCEYSLAWSDRDLLMVSC